MSSIHSKEDAEKRVSTTTPENMEIKSTIINNDSEKEDDDETSSDEDEVEYEVEKNIKQTTTKRPL